MESSDRLTDQGKLLFGAGFVFGVTTVLFVFGVVLVAVMGIAGSAGLPATVVVTLAGGLVFATVVGVGLYYLAFPENRTRVAVDPARLGLDDEE